MASYKGVTINAGDDASVASQVANIDDKGGTTTPVNTMPGAAVGTNPTTYATYFPTSTAHTGLAETATASRDAYLANTAKEADQLTETQSTDKSSIQALLAKLGMASTKKTNLYESSGLNDQQKDIDTITSEMESTGRSFDKQIETIRNTNPEGKLVSGVDVDVNNLTRQKAATLADQAIVLNAKTRNFTTAKSIIDTKVDAETDDLKTQLTGLQYFYDQNAGTLTKDQATLLQQKINEAQDEYDEAKTTRTNIGNIQLEAAKNGAPVSIVKAIGAASDITGATSAAGSYLVTPKTSTTDNFKLSQAQVSQLLSGGFNTADAAQIQSDITQFGLAKTIEGMTPEKQALVKRVFAGSDAVNDASTPQGQFLNADYFSTLFTEDQLKQAADDAGYRSWYTSWDSEKTAYLGHLESIVEQYRKAGYSDQDILKMMQ